MEANLALELRPMGGRSEMSEACARRTYSFGLASSFVMVEALDMVCMNIDIHNLRQKLEIKAKT